MAKEQQQQQSQQGTSLPPPPPAKTVSHFFAASSSSSSSSRPSVDAAPAQSSSPLPEAFSAAQPRRATTTAPASAAKSTNGQQRATEPLVKKPSIISLSDGSDDDDDDLQLLDGPSVPSKRAAPTDGEGRSNSNAAAAPEAPAKKKIKVAALFDRTRNAPSAVKLEEGAAKETVQKLSQYRLAPVVNQNGNAAPSSSILAAKAGPSADSSSSPLPSAPGGKTDKKVLAHRAAVRQRLLGFDASQYMAGDTEETAHIEEGDADSDGDENTPVASTSNSTEKGKKKNNDSSKKGASTSRFSQFAAKTGTGTASEDSDSSSAMPAKTAKGKGKAAAVKYTPLEQQVIDLKKKHPETLLLVEVGYKFKFFGEDAKIAAKELNIACYMSQHFFTAMVPVHRLQVHIKRLVTAGYKVGVVRQKETAALKKVGDNRNAPFTRDLTNLYTSATYIEGLENDAVTGAQPTFGTLMCIVEEPRGGKGSDEKVVFGIVAAQPSTGEVVYDEFEDTFLRAELETRLLHIQPGELVIQGDVSPPTTRVISYILTQETASTGQAGRVDKAQKKLSPAKAISVITAFYKGEGKESRDGNGKKTTVKSKGKGKGKGTSKGAETVVLSDDDEEAEVSDHGMAADLTGDDAEDGTETSGSALATVLGLPEKVIIALAGLLQHLTSFQLQSVFERPKYFTPFAQRGSMLLNSNTIANLEIFRNQTDFKPTHTLFSLLDHTKTSFGQRLLRRWVAKPLLQKEPLLERINAVDEIVKSQSYLLGKMRGLLKGLPDLERGLARIHYGKTTPQELVRVLSAFQRIADEFPDLPVDLTQSSYGFKSKMINSIFRALPELQPIVKEILELINVPKAREGIKEDVWADDHQPEELTDLKDLLDTVDAELSNHLKECRKLLKKPNLEYVTVAQEDYLMEVRISESKIVPADWLRINSTKTVYRYRSTRTQSLKEEREQAVERLATEAERAFGNLLAMVSLRYEAFRDVVVKLATIDCLISLSLVAMLPGYTKPAIVDEPCLDIVGGRHPIVETVSERPFIPNDVRFAEDGLRALVLTGCNMSGKSSYSRMVALLVVMAQIGCYLPCQTAKIGIVDYVGTRFGASDEITRGRSTFMVELTETCEILKASTNRSLVVLDELGRGTSTNDGLAIAHAVLQYIIKRVGAATIFITHFPQLAALASKYPTQCKTFQMAYVEEMGIDRIPDITFLYKAVPGVTDRVHGIACARMAGVPESVCQVAADRSEELEEGDAATAARHRAQRLGHLLRNVTSANTGAAISAPPTQSPTQVVQLARKLLH